MAEKKNDLKAKLKAIVSRGLKATIKGLAYYILFFVLWMLLAPASELISGVQQTIEIFFTVQIAFTILEELASRTIFQHVFNAAKALFAACFLILSLRSGLFNATFQNVNLVIDLRLFFTVATLLSLLGFAKSMIQTINYLSEKAEYARN